MQSGIIFRYFRIDCDHNVSSDPLALSIDNGVTWTTSGVTYVAPGSWPPSVINANTSNPVPGAMTGYWWRTLTGPATPFPLQSGNNTLLGKLTDSPEEPHMAWRVYVDANT